MTLPRTMLEGILRAVGSIIPDDWDICIVAWRRIDDVDVETSVIASGDLVTMTAVLDDIVTQERRNAAAGQISQAVN